MADEDVSVRFGAAVEGLVNGVDEVKEKIESVTGPIGEVMSAFKELGEVIIAALAVEKIVEMISEMAELGEQIERTSAMLGASVKDTQELGLAAKLTGGTAEGMATSMERFQVSLARAQNSTSQQARALAVFNLNARDLIRLPLKEQMEAFAEAVSKFADSPTKTAAIAAINRGFVQMIPLLDQGAAGMEKLFKSGEDVGAILSNETVEGLSSVEKNLNLFKAAITGLAAELIGRNAQAINATITALTNFISSLDNLLQSSHKMEAALAFLRGAMDVLTFNVVGAYKAFNDLHDIMTKVNEEAPKLRLEIHPEGDHKPTAPAMAVPDTDAIKAAMDQYQTAIKLADEQYRQTSQYLESEVKLHKITQDQETAQLRAALADRHTAEMVALDDELRIRGLSAEQQKKIRDEMLVADQKFWAEDSKLVQTGLEKDAKAWQSTLQPIEGAFNSQLRSLLAGTETFGQAMKKIFADLVIAVIEGFEKMAFAKLATSLATAFGDPAAMLASAAKSITTDAGMVYAGEAAFLAPILGPAAPEAAAGIAATVESTALGLSALDEGTDFVLRSGLAIIHQGEQVVPAQATGPYTGASGGGPQIHINGPIIGNQAWINSMVPQLSKALAAHRAINQSAN